MAFVVVVIVLVVGLVAVALLGRLYASSGRPRGISESPVATPPRPRKATSYTLSAPPLPPAVSRGPDGSRSRIDGLTDSERERELKKLIKQFSKR